MFYMFKDQDGYEILANMDNIIYTRITSKDSVLLIDVNGTTKPFTGVDVAKLKQELLNGPVDTGRLLMENAPVEQEITGIVIKKTETPINQTQESERRGPGRPRKF
jgi:hypothetical protein